MTGTELRSESTPKIVDCSSQEDFRETPYEDASWEVVGEVLENQDFIPMEVEVYSNEGLVFDPMFANYGGIPAAESVVRWHLPGEMAYQFGASQKQEEQELAIEKIQLTEEELAAIKNEAFEQGKLEGMTQAVETRNEKLQAIESSILGVTQDMQVQMSEIVGKVSEQAVQLALVISKKLLDTAVEVNPEYIIEIVNQALSLAGTASIQKVRVSPQDMEFIEVVGVRKHIQGYDQSWDFEADSTIRSGCIVDTSAGEIDYNLDLAWQRIQEKVMKVLR